ncbi:MAG: hypothetical protein NW224_06590 [Leptolyngbyaceae cyanobacterium bins.302]|nr:hypothetical protein [Leptolyngbyaceae cyanobacterium bins.302]
MMQNFCYRVLLIGCMTGVILSCSSSSFSPALNSSAKALPDYSRTPILFIHGSGLDSKTWKPMIEHLVSTGYPTEYLSAIDLIPNDGSNVRAASEMIAPAVESLLTQTQVAANRAGFKGKRSQEVDLVSHSMGAVSSRWYIAKLKPERVRTWIAIAGANHGTNAICPFPSDGNSEICPAFATSSTKNPLQIALNGTPTAPVDETPYGLGRDHARVKSILPNRTRRILYFTVRIEPDRWIKPENSAVIDGAGGAAIAIPAGVPVKETSPGNYLFQAQVDHDPLPQHPDLIRFVTALLTTPHPQEVPL